MNSRRWVDRETRRISKAQLLLEPALADDGGVWADLGCGDGVFTYLLCDLLRPGSEIYAVDKNRQSLRSLERNLAGSCSKSQVYPTQADFTGQLALPPLDGLVMGNSLHFVKHKQSTLVQLVRLLKPGGRFVVIEYNAGRGNFAVPYPLTGSEFLTLAETAGLQDARIVSRIPSSFLKEMYTGLALKRSI